MRFSYLKATALSLFIGVSGLTYGQVCDVSVAPQNPTSTYTTGLGVLLQWDVVAGSQAVAIQVELPSGSSITRRVLGFELSQFLIPDSDLPEDGVYNWRVIANCSSDRPFDLTPFSDFDSFTKSGSSGGCDPSVAPSNLSSTYVAGGGVRLEWDSIPGSQGVLIDIQLPSGSSIERRVIGLELNEFDIPDAQLPEVGVYQWRVRASCTAARPFVVTPFSALDSFEKL
jgi:hypothetical protein